MWVLPALGYLGVILGFCFLTLAIASGLYSLSICVEENTVFAKRLLSRLIFAVVGIQLFLWLVDGFPLALSALSIGSHIVYYQNLRRFPIVKLTDPVFIASCVLVLVNHYFWFRHFSAPRSRSNLKNPGYRRSAYEDWDEEHTTFTEVASFFGLCVWLIPFALFVSLSASENVLPSMGSEYATGEGSSFTSAGRSMGMNGTSTGGSKGGSGLAKQLVDSVRTWVTDTGDFIGMGGSTSKRSHDF